MTSCRGSFAIVSFYWPLNRPFRRQPQRHAPVIPAAQVHHQPIAVGHGLGVAVEALQRRRIEDAMATADVEQPVHGLLAELDGERLVTPGT